MQRRAAPPWSAEPALGARSAGGIQGGTDSEHVFALFLDRLAESRADSPVELLAEAMRRTIDQVVELSAREGGGAESYLNLAVSDGRAAIATRFTTLADYAGESLYVNRGRRYVCDGGVCHMIAPEHDGGAVLVSSESLSEDPGWEPVGRNHMVVIHADRRVEMRSL